MSSESEFWQWFQQHESELFNCELDQESVFDKLSDALKRVNENLTFEIGPVQDDVREFVISAAGIKDAFPNVQNLVDVQPSLARFRVIAFRPRRPVIHNIEYDDLKIASRDVYFRLCKDENPHKIGVLLFLPNYAEERKADFGQVGYLFLDEALGEYDVETKVGFIEMMGHDSRHFNGASPIANLAEHFDDVFSRNNSCIN